MAWLVWLVLAVALGVAESLTLTLALGLLAGAALSAAIVAGVGGGLLLQLLAFVIVGALGLLVIRPVALRHMRRPPLIRDGTDALVGAAALVIEEVTNEHGLVRISGEEWSARPYDQTLVIPAGSHVDVMSVEGARLIVYPRELLP